MELKQRFAVKLDKIEAEEKLVQKKAELMQKQQLRFLRRRLQHIRKFLKARDRVRESVSNNIN